MLSESAYAELRLGTVMSGVEEFNRMRWASRRGLLELDLLLAPFVEARYRELCLGLQQQFQQLVVNEDQDILNWIMGRSEDYDPGLSDVIAAIREHNFTAGRTRRGL